MREFDINEPYKVKEIQDELKKLTNLHHFFVFSWLIIGILSIRFSLITAEICFLATGLLCFFLKIKAKPFGYINNMLKAQITPPKLPVDWKASGTCEILNEATEYDFKPALEYILAVNKMGRDLIPIEQEHLLHLIRDDHNTWQGTF